MGYARVSTDKQNIDLQFNALKEYGCEKIFHDEGISGSKRQRPGLDDMLNYVRDGDVVVCFRMDRISRSTRDMLDIAELLKDKGVGFVSIHDNIDTTTAHGQFFFTITAAFSQLERDLIRSRVKDGVMNAKSKGIKLGRPKANEEVIEKAIRLKKAGFTTTEIREQTGVAKSTLYKYLNKRQIEV